MIKKIHLSILKILFILSIILTILSPSISYCDDINNDELDESAFDISEETSASLDNTLILNSRSCIVIDRLSNNILYGKNETNKVKMASTTKIMTSIIIIENCNLKDTVEISKKAAGTGGSRLGLKTGDKVTVNDLLYGLMLRSGNDAAVALAEYCSGSVPEFANLMNTKAEELNLLNTHFESPHGLDSDGHYTTAYELALLSNYALKNKTFLNIVGTRQYTVTINGSPKSLSNTNELLGNLNGVYGIKTGFTNGANRCLVTACKRGDLDIICVVLGADTKKFRTKDSIKLIEYTFSNFSIINLQNILDEKFNIWKESNLSNFTINKGISNNINVYTENLQNPSLAILSKNKDSITIDVNCNLNIDSPIYKNQIIGNINIFEDNKLISQCNILSDGDITKKSIVNYLFDFFKSFRNINLNL